MNNKMVIRLSEIFFLILFTAIIFQNPLMSLNSYFNYVDEGCFLFGALYIVCYILRNKKIEKTYMYMLVVIVAIVVLGLVSNLASDVSRTFFMIAQDIVCFTKDFICFIAAGLYFGRKGAGKNFIKFLIWEVHLILLIAFVCLCISQFADIGMTRGVRYGINCFKFIYSRPGMWSQYCILFLFILTADLQNSRINIKRILYFALLFIDWLATCRARAFVTLAIWLFLMVVGRKMANIQTVNRNNIRQLTKTFLKPSYVIFAVGIICLLGWQQFQEYFGTDATTSRSLLVSAGISIMRDYFPLGSGFGTFGTEVAAQNYSPLYYRYGLNSFWALTEGGEELTDCYWPAVGASLGIFGIILMVILILLFIKSFLQSTKNNKYYSIAALTYCIYLLISSTATGIFSSYITAGFLIICMAIINSDKTKGGLKNGEYSSI